MTKKIIIISLLIVNLFSFDQNQASASHGAGDPNCYGSSGTVSINNPWPGGTATVSCPGREGICPGDSDFISGPGSYDLAGCNCLVDNGCVSVTNLPAGCSVTDGASCWSNNANHVDDITITCQAIEACDILNREYDQCGGTCEGITYPSNNTVHVKEYVNASGSVCDYICTDNGAIAGQCGNPGASPPSYGTPSYGTPSYGTPSYGTPSSTPTCGDKVCNSGETCSSCSLDCGACPAPGNSCGITWCSSIPNQPPNTNFSNVPLIFSSCSGDGCIGTYVNRVDSGPWLANVFFPSGLVSCSNPVTVNNIWSDSAGVHSIQIAARNGSVICTPSTTFTTISPSCDSTISCTGSCTAPSNTCSTNNGIMGSCVYTTYSGGGSCTQVSAPNQACTINNCSLGYTCSSGTCVSTSSTTPWIQIEGDVYSGENIYTPGGP